MYLLGLGIILLLLKYLEFGPPATWSWWVVLAPFAAAAVWWAWADWSGYTKRKAMERHEERKQERIDRQRKAIGRPTSASSRRRR
ncbi:MAG: TIGR04438 family Trp-rich protein [Ottowia sp.]|uniref:TIGR04438 family Trp-rich protein n=1 Tax=Ottowia sp. TaxID=1898956 RepID=UPI003C761AD5